MFKKVKNYTIIVLIIAIVAGYPIMYFLGKTNSNDKWKTLLSNAEAATEEITQKFLDQSVKLTNALSLIASKDTIIENYEARENVQAIVIGVRDIDVQLFKEVQVKITCEKEYPWSILSPDYQLSPDIFGNFMEISDELDVTYYYGAVGNKIQIENIDDKQVNISYSASSFMNPYKISSRNVELNLGAKIMTTMENDEIYQLVNSIGVSQLSDIEDAFVEKIKEEYSSSEVPIYINGTLLEEWSDENKIFYKADIDPMYEVQILE